MKKVFLLVLLGLQVVAQNKLSLPRSTPEAEGVSSQGILDFLEATTKSKHEFHSFMLIRHGKVVSENWWTPYRSDLKHTMYSTSKSFTATAIGFAVAEKKLNVSDKVVSFFPDDLPEKISPNLADLEIRDLLSMSVGHEKENANFIATSDNWVKEFLKTPIVYTPGTKFLYNTPATYMLSAIIQKVTGQKVIDYLQPRLFEPLGIQNIDWEIDPKGINTGGYGLRLKTEDMAKFGLLFLQKGKWNGKQIIPAAWIEEASSMKIMQDLPKGVTTRDSSDWHQGYAYQMWRCRNNGYRADGANGQFIIILPEKDAVIAITAEAPDMQNEINLVWKYILPALKDSKLPKNAKALTELNAKSKSLATPISVKNKASQWKEKISGKTYGVYSSTRVLKAVKFEFEGDNLNMTIATDSVEHKLIFGNGTWVENTTTKFGPYLVARARGNRIGQSPFKTANSYTWLDEKTLELTLKYIESPHTETIFCVFDGDYVTLDFQNIFNKNAARTLIKAVVSPEMTNAPKLIVRGDDMGYSHSGNEALIKSYVEGIETSIEIIVPSPWFPEAVKMLEKNPKIDVGLHFAITSEWDNVKWRPLTAAPSLRNKDGYFYPMLFHNKNYPMEAIMDNDWKIEDIEKELRAQIEMAKKYIPRLSHVSGHMGSLAFTKEMKEMTARIGKEYGIQMVDEGSTHIQYTGYEFRNKTTEERIEGFIKMLDKLETGKTYVFVEHPGLDNEELRAISHIGYEDVAKERQDVTTVFTSEKVKEAVIRKGINLVSYKEALGVK
ncbi:ChbG/HpnK family deacetylase [Lacihabitans sp. CS3-21]|uniref:ChbG/HpnK family deacetylase n=1 Tax=Lacihabitans sp. CS3-21 TaxID=2487332 RepID=UPI0020CEE7E9|nr:ChbG/HpnK family deacetylase [Lacihabitans sp. CS3-21]MCP9748478.1 ChbG/HpnK family deacetylase [Lacihabitans sp. CS3-21]